MSWVVALLCSFAVCTASPREEPTSEDDDSHKQNRGAEPAGGRGLAQVMTGAARVGSAGYGGLLGYRVRVGRVGLGVEVESGFAPTAFIGGYEVERSTVVAARTPLFLPVFDVPQLTIALSFAPGVRATFSQEPALARARGLSATTNLGLLGYLRVSHRLTWTAGVEGLISVQLDPIVDVDQSGFLLVTGPTVPLSERLSWFLLVESGGLFGSDGDAGKLLLRGTTGLRAVFGASAWQWRAF